MAQKVRSRPKKSVTPVVEERGQVSTQPEVSVDYPQEGEKIMPGHYAVRVSAVPGAQVEISVDGGPDQPCRPSVGYYWFDWSPTQPGRVTFSARYRIGKGRWKKSEPRSCTVIGPGTN